MNHFPLKTKQKTPVCHTYGGFFYCREGCKRALPSRRTEVSPLPGCSCGWQQPRYNARRRSEHGPVCGQKPGCHQCFSPLGEFHFQQLKNPHPWASRPAPRRQNSCLHPRGQARARRPCVGTAPPPRQASGARHRLAVFPPRPEHGPLRPPQAGGPISLGHKGMPAGPRTIWRQTAKAVLTREK